MKTLAELRTEVDLGLTVYRETGEGIVRDEYGYWFCGRGLDNRYPSFEAIHQAADDADKPIWTTQDPPIERCPICGEILKIGTQETGYQECASVEDGLRKLCD